MSDHATRRAFLQTSTITGAAALTSQLGFLGRLPRVSAAEARIPPGRVRFGEHLEPLVQLIEETPREKLIEQVAGKIHQGTSYQEILAALLLAGVRNVQPRPAVGFKFHAVLVVNSCHLASLAGPDQDRWLPIFWALDYFKTAQADESKSTGWHMPAVDESRIPDAVAARRLFLDAMDRWDEEQADLATAALVRTAGASELFNLLASYAARDFRSIGHKAIFLANAWRTLQVIGWEHAEPVLRSLTFALLNHSGEPNPAESDLAPDRPWRENAALAGAFPASWLDGKPDDAAPRELMSTFRQQSPGEAARLAADIIARGVSPQSIWDGVFVGAGELLMRQPGIIGLHGLTSANALRYLWQNAADEDLRRRLLLQACAFNVLFRDAARARGQLKDETIESLQAVKPEAARLTVEDLLHSISSNRAQAAAQVEAYLAAGGDPYAFIDGARRLIFLKGRDAHDYKFSSAVLEDYGHGSPAWRSTFLALSVFNLKGTGDRDNQLVERTRDALAAAGPGTVQTAG